MLGKYSIDESSEGEVAPQVDKDLIGECLDCHAVTRGQRVIAWTDGYETILHIVNELNAGPLIFVDDRTEAKIDLARIGPVREPCRRSRRVPIHRPLEMRNESALREEPIQDMGRGFA